jgi:hypothetical protein
LQNEAGVWKYVGGSTFLESTPLGARKYADLMFSLAEKVNGGVSLKYQLPGDELDPENLITVEDDGDVQELADEYARALHLPGTVFKAFRLQAFLFPAAEDAYTPEDMATADQYLGSRASR